MSEGECARLLNTKVEIGDQYKTGLRLFLKHTISVEFITTKR